MILRASLPVALACTLLWTGTASAQELQAGQTMTQSEADRLEAVQSDIDRMDAEEADAERREADRIERRIRERERRRDAYESRLDAAAAEEQRDFGREWMEQWQACSARLPAEQKQMAEQIVRQHQLSVQSIRDSAGEGADVAAAVQAQEALRDQLLAAITGGACG